MSAELPDDLQHRFVAFVRAFGLHRPEQTPCGAPVAVSEAHALSVIDERGPLSQNDLAHHLELAKSTVSRMVDQLERRGWVQRGTSDADGRRRLVELTAEGEKVAGEIAHRRRARLADLLERIPEGDRAAVLGALDTLVEAARDTPAP
jgi:DNA-binding MarR family transcriptional regulator